MADPLISGDTRVLSTGEPDEFDQIAEKRFGKKFSSAVNNPVQQADEFDQIAGDRLSNRFTSQVVQQDQPDQEESIATDPFNLTKVDFSTVVPDTVSFVSNAFETLAAQTGRNYAGMLKGVAKTAAGGVQMALDFAASNDLYFTKEDANDFASLTHEELTEINAMIEETFGPGIQLKIGPVEFQGDDVSEFAGENAIYMAFPSRLVTVKGAKLLQILADGAYAASIAALEAASALQPGEDLAERNMTRAERAETAALIGGPLGAMFSILNRFRSGVSQEFSEALQTDYAKRGKEIDDFIRKNTNAWLKTNQVMDDPLAEGFEIIGGVGSKRQIRRLEKLQHEELLKMMNSTIDEIHHAKDFSKKAKKAFDATVDGLNKTRKKQWDADFRRLEGLVDLNAPAVRANNFRAVLRERISKLNSLPYKSTQQISEREELLRMLNDGSITGKESLNSIKNLISEWGQSAGGDASRFEKILSPKAEKRFAKKAFKALNKDLDVAVDTGIPGAEVLREARENYRTLSEPLNTLKDTAVGKLLGKDRLPSPKKLTKKFTKLDIDDVKQTMRILGDVDPQFANSYRRAFLEEHLKKSVKGNLPANQSRFKPTEFLKIRGDENAKELFDAVFEGSPQKKFLEDSFDAIQRIATNQSQQGGTSVFALIKSASGVAVSWDKTFAARLFTELVVPGKLSKVIMSKEGAEAFAAFAKPANLPGWAAAISSLADILGVYPMTEAQLRAENIVGPNSSGEFETEGQ